MLLSIDRSNFVHGEGLIFRDNLFLLLHVPLHIKCVFLVGIGKILVVWVLGDIVLIR